MGFSTTSTVFGGIIIVAYSISISEYREERDGYGRIRNYHAKMAISVCMLLLGIAEFVIGIWAPMCCFLMLRCFGGFCTCCDTFPQYQVRTTGWEGVCVWGGGGGGGNLLSCLGVYISDLGITKCAQDGVLKFSAIWDR